MIRRAVILVASILGLAGIGGGVALATTHSSSPRGRVQIAPPKLIHGLVKTHVCHPGRKGSMLDSLN